MVFCSTKSGSKKKRLNKAFIGRQFGLCVTAKKRAASERRGSSRKNAENIKKKKKTLENHLLCRSRGNAPGPEWLYRNDR